MTELVYNNLEDAFNCKECSHKDVCSLKKEDGKKQIMYPEVNYISVKVTCNHFRKIQNSFIPRDGSGMKLDEKATRELLFGIGTGIEYLRNEPTCNATANVSEKSCRGCEWENNTIRFDQSPCWGCKENGYSKYVTKEEK